MPPPPAIREQHDQDSRRARTRIGVAAALLVIAIGILAVLNHRKSEQAPTAESTAVPPQTSMSNVQVESAPASATPTPADTAPVTSPAAAETPPPPVAGKLPQAPAAGAQPVTPAAQEESSGAGTSKPYVASASMALGQRDMAVVAVQSPSQTPTRAVAAKAFEVQLGVFSDPENAKQLQAKLQEHGIPSHSETRVQLGPFKDRAEADRAREKLKALGVQAVVVAR